MQRRLFLLVAVIAYLASGAIQVRAQTRSWALESFRATLEVQEDGSVRVEEVIQPRFSGSFNGIFRTIPVDYKTTEGFNYKLFLELESVTDGSGNSLRYDTSREGHDVKYKIYVPGAQDTTKTVVLRYTVENAIRYFDDHDELYWNATGTEWPVPISRASALIKLPDAAAGPNLHVAAYTGYYGSHASEADVEITGSQVSFQTQHGLRYREGLTVVAGWPKGIVAKPGKITVAWRFLRSNWKPFLRRYWVLEVPVVIFLALFALWYYRGRDPKAVGPVMVRYAPPEGLTPGEVGTLVDNSPDVRDITATLVDLAVRGFIRIAEMRGPLTLGQPFYTLRLVKPSKEWQQLKAHEQALLEGVFPDPAEPGKTVALSDLQSGFYSYLPGIRQALIKELIEQECYSSDPSMAGKSLKSWALLVGFIEFFAFAVDAATSETTAIEAILSFALSITLLLIFAKLMPARTKVGAKVRQEILGFEEFLNRAEKDYLLRVVSHPELFDRFLPYAMALGVDRNWARAFEKICHQPPEWYKGDFHEGFRPTSLAHGLATMNAHASYAMTYAPRSYARSESSGFSDSSSSGLSSDRGSSGGSSGGGFGGGGGGAF